MRRRLACAVALLLLGAGAPARAGDCHNGTQASDVCGTSALLVVRTPQMFRDVDLYVPPRLPVLSPVPLVIALPGLYLDPPSVEQSSGFDRFADSHGVAVAYPWGYQSSWNAGTCCGDSAASGIDDVGFLAQVVDTVATLRPIDRDRVYVAGFSNGGMLALRAACERPDVFAAAAAMSGTLEAPCAGPTPVSALVVSGGTDGTVPYAGSRYSSFLHTALTPVPTTVAILAARDGCTRSSRHVGRPYTTRTFTGCRGGSAVELVVAPRLGHAWPTLAADGFDGGELAWQFLSAHTRVPQAS